MLYDYINGKKDITEVLDSKVEIKETKKIPQENEFTFDNGVKAWASAIFVDIVSSSQFFASDSISENVKSRILRSFVEQLVSIFNENEYIFEIGIRGDCVYAVFRAELKENIVSVFRTAYCANTFLKMFNKMLAARKYPLIQAGVGIGTGYDLIIKAGKKRVVYDKIWVGQSLVNASNLSQIANRNGYDSICLDDNTYTNIIEILKNEDVNYLHWIKAASSPKYSGIFYQCNIVQTSFNEWIEKGMPNE